MIYSLRGTLLFVDTGSLVIECGGVGYKCLTTLNTLSSLPQKGNEVFIYTYMNVKEDAVELFGFSDQEELECFKLITSVNGVGPKIGLAILSDFTPDKVRLYIATGDSKALTRATGVGAKLAQRIVLELKDKVGKTIGDSVTVTTSDFSDTASHSKAGEAVFALVSLGYSKSEASLAVGRVDQSLQVEDMIKQALKILAGQVL